MSNVVTRAVARFPYQGGLPRDVAENVLWFTSPTDTATAADVAPVISLAMNAFYGTAGTGGTLSISNYLAQFIDRPNSTVEVSQHTIATGVQIGDTVSVPFSGLDTPTSTSLPAEVALCLSFGGTETGVPVASRRGRVFIGPLSTQAIAATTGYARPAASFINNIAAAATSSFSDLGTGTDWVVYSRKLRTVTLVQGGWVDNEWDTQRRRGESATSRQTWGVA